MTQEEILQVESSQRQHNEEMRHYEEMCNIHEIGKTKLEIILFAELKPKLQKDGNQWCVLYGDNLQEGIAGFGDSPYLAILDWNKNWFTKLSEKTA